MVWDFFLSSLIWQRKIAAVKAVSSCDFLRVPLMGLPITKCGDWHTAEHQGHESAGSELLITFCSSLRSNLWTRGAWLRRLWCKHKIFLCNSSIFFWQGWVILLWVAVSGVLLKSAEPATWYCNREQEIAELLQWIETIYFSPTHCGRKSAGDTQTSRCSEDTGCYWHLSRDVFLHNAQGIAEGTSLLCWSFQLLCFKVNRGFLAFSHESGWLVF